MSLLCWFTPLCLYFFLLFESLSISDFQHETRVWYTHSLYLLSVLVVRGRTLKTNTASICGGAQGGWTTLVLPLANVICTFWVLPALPPSSYMRVLSQVGPVFLAFPRSKPTRNLGAQQGNWQWMAMCFVLFPSPKYQVTV